MLWELERDVLDELVIDVARENCADGVKVSELVNSQGLSKTTECSDALFQSLYYPSYDDDSKNDEEEQTLDSFAWPRSGH